MLQSITPRAILFSVLSIFIISSFSLNAQDEDCPAEMKIFHRSTGELDKNVSKKTFKKVHRKDRHLATSNQSETIVVTEEGDIIEVFRSRKKSARAYRFAANGKLKKQTKFTLKHHSGSGKFIAIGAIRIGEKIFFISYKKDRKNKIFTIYAHEFNKQTLKMTQHPFILSRMGFLGNWALEQLDFRHSPDGNLLFIGHNSGGKKENVYKAMVVNSEFESLNGFTLKLGKKGWASIEDIQISDEGHLLFHDYKKKKTYVSWADSEELQEFELGHKNMDVSGVKAYFDDKRIFAMGSLTSDKTYAALNGLFMVELLPDGDMEEMLYKKLTEEDMEEIMTEEELEMARARKEKTVSKKKKKKRKKRKKKKSWWRKWREKRKKKKDKKKLKLPIPELRSGLEIKGVRKVGDTYVLESEVNYSYVVVTRTDKTTTYTYYYVFKDIFLFGFNAKSGAHEWSSRIEKYRQTVNDNGIKGGYLVHESEDNLDFVMVVEQETLGEVEINSCKPERDIFEPKDSRKSPYKLIVVRVDGDGEKEYFSYGDVYKFLNRMPVLDPIMSDKEECKFYVPAYHYLNMKFVEE